MNLTDIFFESALVLKPESAAPGKFPDIAPVRCHSRALHLSPSSAGSPE